MVKANEVLPILVNPTLKYSGISASRFFRNFLIWNTIYTGKSGLDEFSTSFDSVGGCRIYLKNSDSYVEDDPIIVLGLEYIDRVSPYRYSFSEDGINDQWFSICRNDA